MKKPTDSEVTKYIDKCSERLGLGEWDIVWSWGTHDSYTVREGKEAAVFFSTSGRNANIEISPHNYGWRSCIRHELLHLVLNEIDYIATKHAPKKVEGEITGAVHAAINRILRVFK